ncbi:unnamed protein product [Coccothraustes coccothraustes]
MGTDCEPGPASTGHGGGREGYSGEYEEAQRGNGGTSSASPLPAPQDEGVSGAHRLTLSTAPAAPEGSDAAVPPPRVPLRPAGPQAPGAHRCRGRDSPEAAGAERDSRTLGSQRDSAPAAGEAERARL